MFWTQTRSRSQPQNPTHRDESQPAPFVLEHRFENVRRGTFTPTAAVWLTSALRESGLLRDLAPDDLRVLFGVLSGVSGNGSFPVTPELLAPALGLSIHATHAHLRRLESLIWNGQPLLGSQISESGLHLFHPSAHLLYERQSVISPPPTRGGHVEVPQMATTENTLVVPGDVRESVIAHSRATYTRPRAEVEAEINHFLSPDWDKPLLESTESPSNDEPEPLVTPEAREWLRLKRALVALGVPHHRAEALLEAHPADKIAEQLEWLSYRRARNPVAYIIAAIEKNYAPPPAVSLQRAIEEQEEKEAEAIAANGETLLDLTN